MMTKRQVVILWLLGVLALVEIANMYL